MKIGKIIVLVCFLASLGLFTFATYKYDHSICVACMLLYLISSVVVIANNSKMYSRITMFISLFSFSFLIVNYFYPVFFYLESANINLFQYEFAENAIQKGTYVATVAGLLLNLAIYEDKKVQTNNVKDYNIKLYDWEVWLTAVMSIAFFVLNKDVFTTSYTEASIGGASGLKSYLGYYVLLLYYLIFKDLYITGKKANTLSAYIREGNKGVMIMSIVIALLWIIIGKRVIAMRLVLVFLFSYSFFIKKIGFTKLATFVVAGGLVLFVSGLFRDNKTGVSTEAVTSSLSVQNAAYYGMDLAINSRSLYELVNYADIHGCNYGMTMIADVASVIPMMQSVILFVFGIPQYQTSSAYFVTWLYYGDRDFEIGLGTNLVGDVYVAFGLIGVLLLFYILGNIIKKTERKCSQGDFMYLLMYVIFVADVVFYPRSGILAPLKNMIWIWIIYMLDVIINKQKRWHAF